MKNYCKDCGQRIADDCSVCPICGSSNIGYNKKPNSRYENELPTPKNKKYFWRYIIIAIIMIGLIGLLLVKTKRMHQTNSTELSKNTYFDSTMIDNTILINQKGIIIAVYSDDVYDKIHILVENRSSFNASVTLENYSVNSIMSESSSSVEVDIGKKAIITFKVSDSILQKINEDPIKYISFYFWIYDLDKYFKDSETPVLTAYTNKNDNQKYSYSYGKEIYSDSDVSVYLSDVEGDYNYMMVSKKDTSLCCDISDVYINGYSIRGISRRMIFPKEYAFGEIYFKDSDIANAGIKSIENMEIKVCHTTDDLSVIDYKSNPVTIVKNGKKCFKE